ncbi:GDSL-type esterase/lipase family protein [Streptomyces sp. NPDC057718]|uniref:GDSL-type esterase/lipase family protein n=1 Tax=Streptomyces sp. NPDC057718 TaxID=3346225 RepID=UPI0036C7678A
MALALSGCTIAWLAVVGLIATPAVAAFEDVVSGSWNMQGGNNGDGGTQENRWRTAVSQVITRDEVEVLALQEAGNEPPASAVDTHRVFPAPGVTEFRWNLGTTTRPNWVYVYFATQVQQRNGLAIVSREQATDAVQLAVHSGHNSRPIMGIQLGTNWFFSAHALSGGGVDAPEIIRTAEVHVNQNTPGARLAVLADFNRNPARMPAAMQRNMVTSNAPTQQGGDELDWVYTSQGNNNSMAGTRRGLNSDHFYVRWALNPACNPAGGQRAADRTAGALDLGDCGRPAPGFTYRAYVNDHVSVVLADVAVDGVSPSLQYVSGSTGEEGITVRFSSTPGSYLLQFGEGWCLAREIGTRNVGLASCDPDLDRALWNIGQETIMAAFTGNWYLNPKVNAYRSTMTLNEKDYKWNFKDVDEDGGPGVPAPGDPIGALSNVLVVGDSISNGFEGDYTWRQRLFEWTRSQNWRPTFVGPLTGTVRPDAPRPPTPPTLDDTGSPGNSPPPASKFTGEYARNTSDDFLAKGTGHYAMWGRQLGQSAGTIGSVMKELTAQGKTPDLLLVELGFNDIGWLGAGADLVPTMKRFIDNARAANPEVGIVLANVPQRTTLGAANPQLPTRTAAYNAALAKAIPTWTTSTSRVALADIDSAMDCDPDATKCATTYDGLHPNNLGEYRIASAFARTLNKDFRIGRTVPADPIAVPDRPTAVPAGLAFDGTQQGVTVTWDKVFGSHSYEVQWRDLDDADTNWQNVSPGPSTNRFDLSWQFTNQPHTGHRYEARVRASAGDDTKSAWSSPVSGTAHPTTAAPPESVTVTPGAGSLDVTWPASTGPYSESINAYALWVYDLDTPTVHSKIRGYPPGTRSAKVENLVPGHRYVAFVCAWNAAGEGKPRIPDPVTVR